MNDGLPALHHQVMIGAVPIPGNIFLAPLAGYTDRVFRSICRDFGADFTYSEMVSAEGVARESAKTDPLMRRGSNEDLFAIQLFMGDVDPVKRCLDRLLTFSPTVIDINCGCPVPKVVKIGAGSQLMRSPDKLYEIVSYITGSCSVPVSVKFRLGWDQDAISWKRTADAALEGGASMLTMHSRTRAQGYAGKADWLQIRALKQWVSEKAPSIPVFGSGDLFTAEDAKVMILTTGVDGVMFARGAIGNPFVFREAKALLDGAPVPAPPSIAERKQVIVRHLIQLAEDIGENAACREMRKHVCAYLKGVPFAGPVKQAVVQATSIDMYLKALGQLPEA
ncbi:MAG: tRNA dihydrouridine synthase DusB [Sphaerochaetaceae bacterium]|jgi:nifR3 family TIM-barrel protein